MLQNNFLGKFSFFLMKYSIYSIFCWNNRLLLGKAELEKAEREEEACGPGWTAGSRVRPRMVCMNMGHIILGKPAWLQFIMTYHEHIMNDDEVVDSGYNILGQSQLVLERVNFRHMVHWPEMAEVIAVPIYHNSWKAPLEWVAQPASNENQHRYS